MKSYKHRCELTNPMDCPLIKPSNKFSISALKKFFCSWTTIDENHPKCQQYLISLPVIRKEKLNHKINKHWWIVHPFSKLRFFWENVMMVVYFITFFLITFSVCFITLDFEKPVLYKRLSIIYLFFWIDIFGNCITGFYDKKKDEIILDQIIILKKYIKTYLFLDVFTSFPYDLFTYSWREEFQESTENYFVILLCINLIPLLKFGRYFTFRSYVKQAFLYFDNEDISCHLFTTLISCSYIIHWLTCICNVIFLIEMSHKNFNIKNRTSTWIAAIKDKNMYERYRRSLLIVIENFTSNGYGGIEPEEDGDILFCTIVMIIGRILICYLIITMLYIVGNRKSSESKYEQIVNQVCAYANQKQLPTYMRRRLLAYYHYRFKNSYFLEKKILKSLSDALRKEVVLHSCRRLVENADIFQNLPNHILTLIVTNLKPELYLAKDMIIKAGIQGDCMFFLSSGTVAVLTPTGKEVCYLKDGAHFGEVALLVQDQRRVASVVAVEICEVYRLDRKDFRKCIAAHSDLFAKIERIATERMQQTVLIEEEYKHLDTHVTVSDTKKKKI